MNLISIKYILHIIINWALLTMDMARNTMKVVQGVMVDTVHAQAQGRRILRVDDRTSTLQQNHTMLNISMGKKCPEVFNV